MTPRDFLEQVVRPNIEEAETAFADPRKGFNAVAAVDAFAARIYHWLRSNAPTKVTAANDSAYRSELAEEYTDFGLVRDLAKAQKHFELTHGHPSITSASQVTVGEIGWNEGEWNEARWDGPPQLFVVTNDGRHRSVDALARNAATFLEGILRDAGG